jgi:outer membrane protein OmpA-like peptidoglycan-associated protein
MITPATVFLALVSPASAQDDAGFDAHGFRFASSDADPRAPIGFVRPGAEDGLAGSVAAAFEYATRPLVFETDDGTETVALEDLIAGDIAAGFVPVSPLRLGLELPVFVASSGSDETHPAALGDLRATALLAFVQPDSDGGVGFGVHGALDLPTGDPGTYRGTDGVAGSMGLAATVEAGALTVSGTAGARFAPNTTDADRPAPTKGGDTFEGALSIGGMAGSNVGIGVEGRLSVAFDPAVRTAIGIPAEALASLRYVSDSGAHLLAGVGVGLGEGAGASPFRLVVGGGFGTGAVSSGGSGNDTDADGIVDRKDACPEAAETLNGYLDDDACPDELPAVEFVAVLDGDELPEAQMVATDPAGARIEGAGRVVIRGMPGTSVEANISAGSCRAADAHARVPSQGTTVVKVPVVVHTGQVVVTVTDAAGRALDSGMVRYLADDAACVPSDASLRSGRGTHAVGIGHVGVFVTAAGYDVQQVELDIESGSQHTVDAVLHPTQVSLRSGQVKLSEPLTFVPGSSVVDASAEALLQQVATVMIVEDLSLVRVQTWGEGKNPRDQAKERAAAIVAFLVSLGVAQDRLEAAPMGPLPRNQADRVHFLVK